MHADQLAAVQRRERLGDFRLADARLALEQQGALEMVHHPERGRKVAVGDIADLREARSDGVAGDGARHARLNSTLARGRGLGGGFSSSSASLEGALIRRFARLSRIAAFEGEGSHLCKPRFSAACQTR